MEACALNNLLCYYTENDVSWNRSQMFFKIGVLKKFANFTGKKLCWSLPANLLKRDSSTGVFL